jgi:hypothetical protein
MRTMQGFQTELRFILTIPETWQKPTVHGELLRKLPKNRFYYI